MNSRGGLEYWTDLAQYLSEICGGCYKHFRLRLGKPRPQPKCQKREVSRIQYHVSFIIHQHDLIRAPHTRQDRRRTRACKRLLLADVAYLEHYKAEDSPN